MNISQKDIDLLDRIRLEDVMSSHGYLVDFKTKKEVYYRCPFHRERNASFCIESKDGKQGFYCHGCKVKGSGAIELEAMLSGLDRKRDFAVVCKSLFRKFNIIIEGKDYNSFFHRAKPCAPQKDISYRYKKFGISELRALGCRVEQCFVKSGDTRTATKDSKENYVMRYSWGDNFDCDRLSKIFSCRCVESFVTEQSFNDKEGKDMSWEVISHDGYPIFEFRYSSGDGWYSRKYEPYSRKDDNGLSHKVTWWFSGGRDNGFSLSHILHGDIDFENAYNDGKVMTSEEDHPVIVTDEGAKFKRLVLCSGPRDAMNVYFHSDCHVCWPHSEGVLLPLSTLRKLSSMCKDLYILYDADATGVKMSREIALSFLDFRIIDLPKDLLLLQDHRTGSACKDASDYFYYYPDILSGEDIRSHFQGLLRTAKTLQFWKERCGKQNTGEGSRVTVTKYEILNKNMHTFLPALGLYRYRDSRGMAKFVALNKNKVSIIPTEGGEVELKAIELMKNYINTRWHYYSEELEEAICSSTKISTRTLGQLPSIPLDFNSFGEDFDYFFFKNCAVRITADGWEEESYENLPYAVNEESIIDGVWRDSKERLFEITYNSEYVDRLTEHHQAKLRSLTNQDDINTEKELFKRQLQLYRYKLTLFRNWEDMPPMVQYLWHTCRFFWEQEERGVPMTDIQQQFCHIHFINKIGALGYFLSRYRTSRRQYMVEMTDYHIINGKRNGRNGKSTVGKILIPLVRKGQEIVGQTFKSRNETIGINFNQYVQTRDSYIYIDDLNTKVPVSTFINLLERITIKTLYYNEETVSAEESPKILISHNVHFTDQDVEGTYRGRLYTMYFSDYYHEATDDGRRVLRTPESEFGDLLSSSSEKELQQTREMLAYALSFYLRENKERGENVRIEAPIESHDEMEKARRSLHNDSLWEWANLFFMKPHHFKRPMSRSSMCISYMRYRNSKMSPDRYVRITKQSVANELDNFQKDLESYCHVTFKMQKIVYNPISIFKEARGFDSKPNINGTCMMRKDTWVMQYDSMNDEYDFSKPRVLANDRCYYFYRSNDMPKSIEDIYPASMEDEDSEDFRE